MIISGKVVSGLGKGSKYVEKYVPYFERILGFTCHLGTLNIKIKKTPSYENAKAFTIKPNEPDLGEVDCYLIRMNGYDGAIVIPKKTEHKKEILEIISPVNLRELMELKDGDEIECELV